MTGLRLRLALLMWILALAAAATGTQPTLAQAVPGMLDGQVIGPDGGPVAGQIVVLHRVAGGSGATVAEDTSDAEGRFTLRFEPAPDEAAATYFVASRWEGELYIGPPFRTPIDTAGDYTMQVGVPGTSASTLLGTAPQRPPSVTVAEPFPYRTWLFLIIPLVVMALAAGYLLTRGRGRLRRRQLLLEIARLDETFEAELEEGTIADSTRYWAERRSLLERLGRES